MKIALTFFFTFFTLIATVNATPVDTHEFANEADQRRAVGLANELRCPQCQNQNLVDSNSPIALDMRQQVYTMVDEGKSNQEIKDFFTIRYGDFVLYRPRFDSNTYMLWLGPVAFLFIGIIAIFFVVRNARKKPEQEVTVSSIDKEKLDKLLNSSRDS